MNHLSITPFVSSHIISQYQTFWQNAIMKANSNREPVENMIRDYPQFRLLKSLITCPPSSNLWRITPNGNVLSMEDTAMIKKLDINWLFFVIYHFFNPLNIHISGRMVGKLIDEMGTACDYILVVDKNKVELQCFGKNNRTLNCAWDPAIVDKEFNSLRIHIMKKVFHKTDLQDWNIVDSEKDECYIDGMTKTIHLGNAQLMSYTRKFGLRGVINRIQKRANQISRSHIRAKECKSSPGAASSPSASALSYQRNRSHRMQPYKSSLTFALDSRS
jgi:hypothetical protein